MANFVTNIVYFDGHPQRIIELRSAVQDDKYGMSGIDFGKIIANWRTKWNAFRFDDDDHYSDSKIIFVTANTAPAPIMQKLSEIYPDITMGHLWADDNVGYNCGERTCKAGKVVEK